jgi:hypothetical protein
MPSSILVSWCTAAVKLTDSYELPAAESPALRDDGAWVVVLPQAL